jgi:hypothetical protein
MKDGQKLLVMCARCHEIMEIQSEQRRDSVGGRIITRFANALIGIFSLILRVLFGSNRP